METEKNAICCSHCHEEIKPDEKITLDVVNTVTHESCNPTGFNIRDSGYFQEMKSKYRFLTLQEEIS